MANTKKNTGKKQTTEKKQSKPTAGSENTKKSKSAVSSDNTVKYVPSEKEKKLRNEIMLLIALAATILLELSCFGFLSPLGDYIGYFIFGCFGWIGYILPIVGFLGVAFLISNKNSRNAVIKFTAGVILLFLISAAIQLIFLGHDSIHGPGYFYMECGREKSGGGFFGSLISDTLCSLVGMIGAYIIILLLIIVCLIVITEKSFIGGVKKGSKKIYKTAKSDVERIKESAENYSREKNYQKNKRINKKVKGVNLSKLENPYVQDEDIHEITGAIPENASVYRGKVDLTENSENVSGSADITAAKRETAGKVITGYDNTGNTDIYSTDMVNIDTDNMYTGNTYTGNTDTGLQYLENESGNYVNKYHGSAEDLYEPPQEDEEGFFKPKERIDVRESAKAVMNRPMYGTGAKISPQTEVSETGSKGYGSESRSFGADGSSQAVQTAQSSSVSGNSQGSSSVKPKKKIYVLPKTTILNKGRGMTAANEKELRETAELLKGILKNFGVNVDVTEYHKGPSVTRYEVQPEIGTRLSKITALADDIKLNMAATDIRIEPIPGKSTIGIEVPNKQRESVLIRDLIESQELRNNKSKIAFAAGMDIAGNVVVGDIAKMPHMLVAGTTGSGKSVFTNSIIQCILFRATPDEVRLIIIDPKVVEFGVYNGIPHLLQPVVTDPRLASNTLKWAVNEMSERYKKFADINVRDLKGYNEKMSNQQDKLPQIVIVIDELADLMMVAAKEVEESICRLAQLARAAGIHLIIATQRPSVDVVTGLIKANIPSRVALSVSSGVDSRTVIDTVGAEKLLGNGDMLFYPSGYVKPVRLQGAFVSDEEVQRVVDFWKQQAGNNDYDERISNFVTSQAAAESSDNVVPEGDGNDEYFVEAVRFCIEKQKASVSMIQRMFHIGFNRASRIIEQMEAAGVIGAEEGTKPRKVLMTIEEFEQSLNERME